MKKWESQCKDLPKDYGFSLQRLTRLMTRPHTLIRYLQDDMEMRNVAFDNFDADSSQSDDHAIFTVQQEEMPIVNYQENIYYATSSKTVDIKRLKEGIWSIGRQEDTFLGIVDKLPSSLPGNEVDNLSIHSCFISVLHLANEHGLELEPLGSCDFKINHKRELP